MVDCIPFPVVVVSRDRTGIKRFASFDELSRDLERIDIENEEYDAWDSTGFRLEMFVRNEESWLGVTRTQMGIPQLREALVGFATFSGVKIEPASLVSDDAGELFETVEAALREKIRRLPWYRRLLRRF